MTEHSRGPWSIHINDKPVSLLGRIEVTTDAGIVCLIHPWEDPTDLADARLIAASVDLFEAALRLEMAELAYANCEECEGEGVPECCEVCFPLFDDARVMRRNAIAKARGATITFPVREP